MKALTTAWLCSILFLGCSALAALRPTDNEPFSKIPAEKRDGLRKRLEEYVKENKNRDWVLLYGLISDTGRGRVDQPTFVARMQTAHGKDFANDPDLLEFRSDRADPNGDGFDVYGCGKAQREGQTYNGIAVIHAVL
jgi:hypothetical protein